MSRTSPDTADDTAVPRYSARPFPRYRHVPGETPHPRRHSRGHSYGLPEPASGPWDPSAWRSLELWLHAVDLFNHGYWWECHEALEGLWRAADEGSLGRRFVQGLVLVAAGYLNRHRRKPTAPSQAERGLRRMEAAADGTTMGIDVAEFARAVRADFAGHGPPARIRLSEP